MTRRAQHKCGVSRSAIGFTLIEIIVVVAIIMVLLGIGIAYGPGMLAPNEEAATRTTLKNLSLIADENKLLGAPTVNHRLSVKTPYDWTDDKLHNAWNETGTADGRLDGTIKEDSIERFVWGTMRGAAKEMYGSFADNVMTDTDGGSDLNGDGNAQEDGFWEIRDAWGNKIVYVTYVRHDDGHTNDGDDDYDDFLPVRSYPFFASAGPDGKWGDFRELQKRLNGDSYDEDEADPAADNIYSFERK